jgi:hypothetical protein
MTTYVRIFASVDTIRFQIELAKAIAACDRVNAKALRQKQHQPLLKAERDLLKLLKANRAGLNAAATRTAATADAAMKANLKATATRTPTGVSPHLSSLLVSRPLQPDTGWVGVARKSTLDRSVNPNTPGYGPYWRAQEYGTGSPEVASQKGRVIVGFFYGRGGSGQGSRPASVHAGGGGPHPVFISGSQRPGPRGGVGGKGTIDKEIDGRHFIEDGANTARDLWRREMRNLDHASAVAISGLRASPGGGRRGRP